MRWRSLFALLASALVPSLAVAAPAGSVLQVRADAPPVSPDQANALAPAALGDLLLGPGHPPVVEATIGPEGLEPPPPPGAPVATRIKLYLQPSHGLEPGFCERIVATIYLKPVDRLPDGNLPAAGPDKLSTETAYRWVGKQRDAACDAPRYAFFIPDAGEKEQALQAVRLLASASRAAQQSRRLTFEVSVEDKEGPEMAAFERDNPQLPAGTPMQTITDARQALAALPVDMVQYAGRRGMSAGLFHDSDPVGRSGRTLQAMTLFLGGDWYAGLVIDGGRIKLIRLLRKIPAPF